MEPVSGWVIVWVYLRLRELVELKYDQLSFLIDLAFSYQKNKVNSCVNNESASLQNGNELERID